MHFIFGALLGVTTEARYYVRHDASDACVRVWLMEGTTPHDAVHAYFHAAVLRHLGDGGALPDTDDTHSYVAHAFPEVEARMHKARWASPESDFIFPPRIRLSVDNAP